MEREKLYVHRQANYFIFQTDRDNITSETFEELTSRLIDYMGGARYDAENRQINPVYELKFSGDKLNNIQQKVLEQIIELRNGVLVYQELLSDRLAMGGSNPRL